MSFDTVMQDEAFQAACQRYAHGNGSSAAIAATAIAAHVREEARALGCLLPSSKNDAPLTLCLGDAQTSAYAEGRKDEREDLIRLLGWAYSKLHHIDFSNQHDALALDEIKLVLMGAA